MISWYRAKPSPLDDAPKNLYHPNQFSIKGIVKGFISWLTLPHGVVVPLAEPCYHISATTIRPSIRKGACACYFHKDITNFYNDWLDFHCWIFGNVYVYFLTYWSGKFNFIYFDYIYFFYYDKNWLWNLVIRKYCNERIP